MIVSKPCTNKFFKKQFASFYNKTCLICSNKSPIYTNLTLSTYLCSKCAGKQRAIYKIKSTIHDTWTEAELKRMQVGGNQLASERGIVDFDTKQIDSYVSEIDERALNYNEDMFKEEDEHKIEDFEVEEYSVPKLGYVYNKEESSSEEIVKETHTKTECKEIETPTTKYKVKTNKYSFMQKSDKKLILDGVEEERLGLAGVDAQKSEINVEQKYSYKNLLQPKKKVEEKSKIKKVVKNVTESSKLFIGNIINKFRK